MVPFYRDALRGPCLERERARPAAAGPTHTAPRAAPASDEWARLPAQLGAPGPVSRRPVASRAKPAIKKRYNEHTPTPIGRTEAAKWLWLRRPCASVL